MAKEPPRVICTYGTEDAAEILMRSFQLFLQREREEAAEKFTEGSTETVSRSR